MTALARSILSRSFSRTSLPTVASRRHHPVRPVEPVPEDLRPLFPFAVMRCHYCSGRMYRLGSPEALVDPGSVATRDHVVPKCDGGTEIVPCCSLCNSVKGDDPYQVFRTFMRYPDAEARETRRTAYRRFRVALLEIGLAAFQEELARIEGEVQT